jgi:hypothetical protein
MANSKQLSPKSKIIIGPNRNNLVTARTIGKRTVTYPWAFRTDNGNTHHGIRTVHLRNLSSEAASSREDSAGCTSRLAGVVTKRPTKATVPLNWNRYYGRFEERNGSTVGFDRIQCVSLSPDGSVSGVLKA